jgi:Flp pilus assembly protein TadG
MPAGQFARGLARRTVHGPIRARLAEECGSNLVEYAFMFIPFMLLMFGIAGFGHALYAYHFVSTEAREATRWAAVNGSTCNSDTSCNGLGGMNSGPVSGADIATYVANHTPPGIDPTQITVTSTWIPANCNTPGCTVEVQVSYNFHFIFPLISTSALPLSSTSEMVIAH